MAKNAINYTGTIPEAGDSFKTATLATTSALNGIDTKIGEIKSDMSTIKQNVSTNTTNISNIEQNITTMEQEISTIEQNVSTNTTDIIDLKNKSQTETYNMVALMQADTSLTTGDVVETLGYTTVNDGLGRKYIITDTDVDSLGIMVNGKYASKFKETATINLTKDSTAPTATVGTDTNQIATTAFVNAMLGGATTPAKYFSSNGYVKMANGLIIQWGRGETGESLSVTFPIVFPSACLNVVVTANVNADGGNYVSASKVKTTSTSGATLYVNAPNCYWIAIGY